ELYAHADALREPVPVVAAGGADRTVLEALATARDRGWVAPAVAGPEADIRRAAEEGGIDLGRFTVIDSDEPAAAAVAQVRSGPARLLMKGQVATPALMKAVLDPAGGLRTGRVGCQIVLMEVRPEGRRFLLADAGVCIRPTRDQQADILRSAADVARALGEPCPRVALMAATEQVTEAMPETLNAAELVRRAGAGEFPGCAVQGP